MMKAECVLWLKTSGVAFVRLPLRGQRRLEALALANRADPDLAGVDSLLLPVELQHVNHAASTNRQDSTWQTAANPTIKAAMSNQHQIDQITERVEQLLLRHEELQRANTLLTHERDSLRSRLNAARSRVDALIERLPEGIRNTVKSPAGNGTES